MATAKQGCSRSLPGDFGDNTVNEDDERIDKMNFMQTIREGRQHGVTFKDTQRLPERQWLLKYKTLCSGTSDLKPADFLKTMEEDTLLDTERRLKLITEFEGAVKLLESVLGSKDVLVKMLKQEGYASSKPLWDEMKKLTDAKAPILVLGETGSGKSSFLNLLLGNDYLPKSILSNTHVVSKIQYGPKPSAYLYKQDKNIHSIENSRNEDLFKEELAEHVQKTEGGTALYDLADIYLPCDVLKCGLVVVDSPGIGENAEMEQMVLDYILKACTFIYIIDSMTAGGIQLRMEALLNKAYTKAMAEEKIYNPETAIFICNKWDLVDQSAREDAKKNAETKITRFWPNCKKEQIFILSTNEALFIQKEGGIAPKFLPILKQINRLLPLGREMLVRKSYNKLEQFYCRCLMMMWAFKHQSGKSDTEKKERSKLSTEKLKSTDQSIENHHKESAQWLENEIKKKAEELNTFMNSAESLNAIGTFSTSKLPNSPEWEKASVEVRYHVQQRVEEHMASWIEKKGTFQNIAAELCRRVREEFPKFINDIADIQMDISPFRAGADHLVRMKEEFTLLPKAIQDTLKGAWWKTVGLGALMSPVLLVLAIGRGAAKLGFKVADSISEKSEESNYKKAYAEISERKKFCEVYAKEEVTKVLKGADYTAIVKENFQQAFTYLKKLKDKMNQVIIQEKKLLAALKHDMRSEEEIRDIYEPMIANFERGLAQLRKYFNEVFCKDTPVENVQELLPRGWTASRMFEATSVKPYKTEAYDKVWLHKSATGTTLLEEIKILTAYRELSHVSIVKCLGTTEVDGILYQLMTPLARTLRCHLSDGIGRRRMILCSEALIDVMSGLSYLHQKGFVHFDLSLDSIFVDEEGCTKLTNINIEGTSVQVDLVHHAEGLVFPGHYTHLPLKFLHPRPDLSRAAREQQTPQYRAQDDMYSAGIMMWEMYLGRPLFNVEERLDTGFGESENQVGGRVVYSRHAIHNQGSMPAGTVQQDEAAKYELLRETLQKHISVCRKKLTAEQISGEFWKTWTDILFNSLDGKLAAEELTNHLKGSATLMRT